MDHQIKLISIIIKDQSDSYWKQEKGNGSNEICVFDSLKADKLNFH